MDASKLVNQLVKEAKASPAKAAALGVLCLVAIWFWGPLVLRWLRPEDASVAESAPVDVPSVAEGVPAAASPKAAVATSLDWRTVQKLRAADRRVTPANLPPTARDPFQHPVVTTSNPEASPAVEEGRGATLIAAEITPADAGLTLQGTVLGGRRRLATINGRTFEQGDRIQVAAAGSSGKRGVSEANGEEEEGGLEFRLIEVGVDHVTLQRRGASWRLSLPPRIGVASDRVEIGKRE